jgi:hypothetical protein
MRRQFWIFIVIMGMIGGVAGCSLVPNEEERIVPTIAPPRVASATLVATASVPPIPTEPIVNVPVPTATPLTEAEVPPPVPTAVPDGETRIVQQMTSPDGQWMVTTTYTGFDVQGPVEGTFTLTNLQTNEEMLLEALTVTPGQRWLEQVPFTMGWTPDSQSLYYSYLGIPMDGCVLPFESNLYQYTLATQSHETLSTPPGSGHLFLPTGEQVAYFPEIVAVGDPALGIYTPATDEFKEILLPPLNPSIVSPQMVEAELLWHPDGNLIALSVTMSRCTNPTSALLLADIAASEITLLASGESYYSLDKWYGNTLVLRNHMQFYDADRQQWVNSLQITPVGTYIAPTVTLPSP